MGCINSKVIARSMSIRDELNHGFHSSSLSWEELLTSHDQLFAFVCSANTDTIKPRLGNASLPSTENHDSGVYTRSRSHDRTICETNEDKFDLRDNSLTGGSRSFHTVEEYDALLERIRKFSSRSVQHFETNQDSDKHETGWKRKALAKELKPLEVTSTVEFPDIARSRQRQVDSPGTYVTPKFGSYNVKACSKIRENENGEDSVFSRELVSAFEDCMKQLRYDEESILWEMDGYPSVDDEMEIRD
ncbi:hypothetical protein CASFOL_028554 [Castilleja foliolosa]|uniref:Uncharacterized protein n=1 Tax=Castilleja foliolosa TaxID=1961234 RepID=A0ABD3CDR4_9LAMI